jgi:hypothetical protein
MRAPPPFTAMILGLRPNQMSLQPSKCPLSVRHCQPDRPGSGLDRGAIASTDLVHADNPVRSGQLDNDPPPHPALQISRAS